MDSVLVNSMPGLNLLPLIKISWKVLLQLQQAYKWLVLSQNCTNLSLILQKPLIETTDSERKCVFFWMSPDLRVSSESIYRRGARRWRKLYYASGHAFQAKRFNRVRPAAPFFILLLSDSLKIFPRCIFKTARFTCFSINNVERVKQVNPKLNTTF